MEVVLGRLHRRHARPGPRPKKGLASARAWKAHESPASFHLCRAAFVIAYRPPGKSKCALEYLAEESESDLKHVDKSCLRPYGGWKRS